MWETVLVMGVAAAMGAKRLTAVVFLVSRSRPMRLLLAYFGGGAGMTLVCGGAILFGLEAAGLEPGSVLPSELELALGVLALLTAAVVGSGLPARLRDWWRARRPVEHGQQTEHGQPAEHGQQTVERAVPSSSGGWPGLDQLPGYGRLPRRVQAALASESPWIAGVAGVLVGLPNLYLLAAIAAVLDAGVGPSTQLAALVVFSCLAFAQAVLPLVSLVVAPNATRAGLDRLGAWVTAHYRPVVATLAAVTGVYLVLKGLSKL